MREKKFIACSRLETKWNTDPTGHTKKRYWGFHHSISYTNSHPDHPKVEGRIHIIALLVLNQEYCVESFSISTCFYLKIKKKCFRGKKCFFNKKCVLIKNVFSWKNAFYMKKAFPTTMSICKLTYCMVCTLNVPYTSNVTFPTTKPPFTVHLRYVIMSGLWLPRNVFCSFIFKVFSLVTPQVFRS